MAEQKQRVHMLMAVFQTEEQALDAFNRVRSWGRDRLIDLKDIAIVTRGADSQVHVRDVADPGTGKGASIGAVVGGAVGLIFPPSIIATAAVGAAVGGAFGHFRDRGLENKKLVQVGEKLAPGQSAVIAATEDQFEEDVVLGLQGLGEVDEYFLDIDTGELREVKQS